MKILSIEMKNFKPFRDLRIPEDGELPPGLILVKGPNSTGKSSLFEAILWGLWGPGVVELKNEELISFTATHCQVVMEFEVAGTIFKMDRTYDPANGMEVVFWEKKGSKWRKIADKSRSVESKLEEILNLGYKQALNTLLVRQGEVATIAYATPTDLRKLLEDVYNIELLDNMSSHLNSLESDIGTKIQILTDKHIPPKALEENIVVSEKKIARYNEELETTEQELEKLEKIVKKSPDPSLLDLIEEKTKELDRAKGELERVEKNIERELEKAGILAYDPKLVKARAQSLKKELEKLEEEQKQLKSAIENVDQEIGGIEATKNNLERALEDLERTSEGANCPTCSKPLTEDERKSLIKEYRDTIKTGNDRVTKLRTIRKQSSEKGQQNMNRATDLGRATDALKRIEEEQKEVISTTKKVTDIETEMNSAIEQLGVKDLDALLQEFDVRSLSELQTQIARFYEKIGSLQRNRESIKRNITEERGLIKTNQEKIKESEKIGAEIEELRILNEHTQYVRRKLVSGFLADYVIQKRLIGIIRGATNPYVRAFTNDQYSGVDLVPTRGKGRGGAGLSLKIKDQRDNAEKKNTQLSFGDRTAISLALRLGISRTMSSIRPLKDSPALAPRIRCVLLDEPLGGLDRKRRTSVVQNLVNDRSFEQILLITHTDVQGWAGVPVIEVSKEGSSSTAQLVIEADE